MNLKLHLVVPNFAGVTGLRIIRTTLAGERDPLNLAARRNRCCKNDVATIARALDRRYHPGPLFSLRQAIELFDRYQAVVAECDEQIETVLVPLRDTSRGRPLPPHHFDGGAYRNALAFDARAALFRVDGTDLTLAEGTDTSMALTAISRSGLALRRWPSHKHLAF